VNCVCHIRHFVHLDRFPELRPIPAREIWFSAALLPAPAFGLRSRQLPKLGFAARTCDERTDGFLLANEEDKMPVGTVKFFNTQKGYGFIQPSDGGKDVFVHISAVERSGMHTLNEGQKVSFEVVTERGKTAAANLKAA
jgi:CspA family cold shock protein